MDQKVYKGFEGTAQFERIRTKMSIAYLNEEYGLAMKYSRQLDDLMNIAPHLDLLLPKKCKQKHKSEQLSYA